MSEFQPIENPTNIDGLPVPLEEYFRYHPPTSEERIAKHDAVNQVALSFAKAVLNPAGFSESDAEENAEYWLGRCVDTAKKVCSNGWLQEEAITQFAYALDAAQDSAEPMSMLCQIQNARMYLNQAITIDEVQKHYAS